MIRIKKYILIALFFSFTVSANSQEIISKEIQNKIGIRFFNQMYKQHSKFAYLYKGEFQYENQYWRKEGDTINLSKKAYYNYEQMKSFDLLYLSYFHFCLDKRDIFSDLIINSKSDTLHIMVSHTESVFKRGITYWENNKMDTVYAINAKYFDNYKRDNRYLLVPDMSYTKYSNDFVIQSFFEGFTYRDSETILQSANSFDEWIRAYKSYPTYSRLGAVSGEPVPDKYFYVKIYIPQEEKLQFEFVDFVLFVH